jgi:hypothetical protein
LNDLTNAGNVGGLSIVENLAREARHYSEQTSFNMLQLGRVLTEAKELVPHGEWAKWVGENADVDIRGAQYFMQCYATYGLDPEMAKLGQSKLRSMLALTDGQREKLLAENDVQNMSVRKLKDEVRKAREEEQEKAREAVAAEKVNAAKMAESAARKAEKETREKLEEEMDVLRAERADYALKAKELQERAELAEAQVKDATEAAINAGKDVSARSAELEAERRRILQELEDKDAVIQELQEQYDQISRNYLDAQSAIAKGDAERSTADILSADAVSEAVRMFIGQVGRVPYMHGTFATMDDIQLEEYRANVLQVKEWAEKSLKAMNTVNGNGGRVE